MTRKQKMFADEYLVDLNATRAYMAVYKNCKSEAAAAAAAARLLRNVKVKAYIDEQLEKIHSAKIADIQEVMEYLTAVMRREHKESIVVTTMEEVSTYVPDDEGVPRKQIVKKETPQVVEIPAKLSDANKAAELLGKRYGLFTDNLKIDGVTKVVFEGESELDG